MANR
jgi:uncharacterized protein (DUF3084 family)